MRIMSLRRFVASSLRRFVASSLRGDLECFDLAVGELFGRSLCPLVFVEAMAHNDVCGDQVRAIALVFNALLVVRSNWQGFFVHSEYILS